MFLDPVMEGTAEEFRTVVLPAQTVGMHSLCAVFRRAGRAQLWESANHARSNHPALDMNVNWRFFTVKTKEAVIRCFWGDWGYFQHIIYSSWHLPILTIYIIINMEIALKRKPPDTVVIRRIQCVWRLIMGNDPVSAHFEETERKLGNLIVNVCIHTGVAGICDIPWAFGVPSGSVPRTYVFNVLIIHKSYVVFLKKYNAHISNCNFYHSSYILKVKGELINGWGLMVSWGVLVYVQ